MVFPNLPLLSPEHHHDVEVNEGTTKDNMEMKNIMMMIVMMMLMVMMMIMLMMLMVMVMMMVKTNMMTVPQPPLPGSV